MITVTHREWCALQHDDEEQCEARLGGVEGDGMIVDLVSPTYETDLRGDEVVVCCGGNEIASPPATVAANRLREFAAVLLNAADDLDGTEGIVPARGGEGDPTPLADAPLDELQSRIGALVDRAR